MWEDEGILAEERRTDCSALMAICYYSCLYTQYSMSISSVLTSICSILTSVCSVLMYICSLLMYYIQYSGYMPVLTCICLVLSVYIFSTRSVPSVLMPICSVLTSVCSVLRSICQYSCLTFIISAYMRICQTRHLLQWAAFSTETSC